MKKKYNIFILLSFLFVISWVLPGFLATSNAAKTADLTEVPILFVDDDDGESYDYYFTDIMDDLGLNYTYTDTRPDAIEMGEYAIVIWHTGDYYGSETPSEWATDELSLIFFLQNGGRLFLSSQDWLYDQGLSTFVVNYLGVASVSNDWFGSGGAGEDCPDILSGTAGDPIGGTFSPFNTSFPSSYEQYGDYILPTSFAHKIFYNATLPSKNATAIRNENSDYNFKTVFFSVPFEAHNLNRTQLMINIISWLIIDPSSGIPGFELDFLSFGLFAIGLLYYIRFRSPRKFK
ncbi:MAG TPA: hypothetical protein VMV49_01490 [Candidatus Deferrimicrobium sp.]|nr:hypothetical protein [Candidatus Deferrimicrobium sp.]